MSINEMFEYVDAMRAIAKIRSRDNLDLIILYSGGSDSRLMRQIAEKDGRKPLLLHVDYGQYGTHHHHEHASHRTIKIIGLDILFNKKYEAVAQDYIPNRNMVLVSIAGMIAEQEGIREIWYGANRSDIINLYPDCYPNWILLTNKILPMGVVLKAPLINFTQEEVLAQLDGYACE